MSLSRRAVFISSIWPQADASAIGSHNALWVRDLLDFGFDVTYAATAVDHSSRLQLESDGVRTEFIKPNDSSFDRWISKRSPELVVFDRFFIEEQFGWRVHENAPDAFRVLHTQDLHCLRSLRDRVLVDHDEAPPSLPDKSSVVQAFESASPTLRAEVLRELASILRSDLSIVVSEFERDLLREVFGIPDSKVVRLGLIGEHSPFAKRDYSDRRDIVFLGNYRHPPNQDAARLLKRRWPKLREKLGCELHLIGAHGDADLQALDDPRLGFRVIGAVENLDETLSRYRIMLAPLRSGAGQKGKLLDALRCGVPFVTTSIGAEGMDLPREFCFEFGEKTTWKDWDEAALKLYTDERIWNQAREAGFSCLERFFSPKQRRLSFESQILTSLRGRESLRRKDWLGAMVRQEERLSKRYLSRWIEAKN